MRPTAPPGSPSGPPPPAATPRVSVIIPTLNERAALPATLDRLREQYDPPPHEVIVADGGSTDSTPDLTSAFARVVRAPRGRAAQMNAGASAASGEVFLFLHADTLLSRQALAEVIRVMQDSSVAGGAFRLRIEDDRFSFRVLEAGVNLRSRLLRLPYGDQGIFIRRSAFNMLNGYRSLPIMEDVDLVLRLRKRGRLVVLNNAATTSPRRWRRNGLVRTTLANWVALAMFAAGVDTQRIHGLYRAAQRGPRQTVETDLERSSHTCRGTETPTTSS